jgi:hypothetical protein
MRCGILKADPGNRRLQSNKNPTIRKIAAEGL